MVRFSDLGVKDSVVKSMKKMEWKDPTPIQEAAIPVGLEGKDILAQAQTGTGKTGAFGSIILGRTGSGYKTPSAIVIVPTRELAIQVNEELTKLAFYSGHKCIAVYGGTSIDRHIGTLKNCADIVVGTPGRMKDLLTRNALRVSKTSIVVLDEADRMLDMGFAKDLDFILSKLPKKRQSLLFSATMPDDVRNLALNKMRHPQEILISKDELTLDLISQHYMVLDKDSKKDALCALIDRCNTKTIVFGHTKRRTMQLSRKMESTGYKCTALHGDIPQAKREKIFDGFRKGTISVLIATDVAARGLDIDDVGLVVNYDMTDPETYVHRIGRTGRADKKGMAVTFVLEDEVKDIERIMKSIDKKIDVLDLGKLERREASQTPKEKVNAKSGTPKKPQEKKIRFTSVSINIGVSDDITKQELMEFIQDCADLPRKSIGKIIMGENLSFIEVPLDQADKICEKLSEYDFDDKALEVRRKLDF